MKTIINELTGNAAFPTPPITMAALTTARDDFTAKISAAQVGGPMATAAKNNSRGVLLGMMRKLAGYVQLSSNDDMAILLSSGFLAMSTDRASAPLEKPHGLTIKNGNSGQLVASINTIKNTSMYEGRAKDTTGNWLPSIFTGDSRHITFDGLTPGTNYTIQVRALGGATGQSDWSDPISHMSM